METGKIQVPKTAKELKREIDRVSNDPGFGSMKEDLQLALIKSFAKKKAVEFSNYRKHEESKVLIVYKTPEQYYNEFIDKPDNS